MRRRYATVLRTQCHGAWATRTLLPRVGLSCGRQSVVRAWSERARRMMRAGPRIGMGLRFLTEVIFGPSDSPVAERAAARRTHPSGPLGPFPCEGDLPMALYMYQAAYTAESVAA